LTNPAKPDTITDDFPAFAKQENGRMNDTILASPSQSGDLARITAERTRLLAAKFKLYQSSFAPNADSVIGDFNAAEADFTGYAAAVIVWDAIGLGSDGHYQAVGSDCFFQATDAVSPNDIGGAWLETGAGALVEYYPFNTPISLSVALAYLNCGPILREPGPDTVDLNW
jgi:hypothetical protein